MGHLPQQRPSVKFWPRKRWRGPFLIIASLMMLFFTVEGIFWHLERLGRPGASCVMQVLMWKGLVQEIVMILLASYMVYLGGAIAMPGPILEINATGIRVRDLGRRLTLSWSQISGFTLRAGNVIGVDVANPELLRRWPDRFAFLIRRASGMPPLLIATGERGHGIQMILDALEAHGPPGLKISRSRQGPGALRAFFSKPMIILMVVLAVWLPSTVYLPRLICG